jgi:hypothetical protein
MQGNLPAELRKTGSGGYDPALPEALRATVTQASEAELDPKRGPGNAMEILSAERAKHPGEQAIEQAIDLRKAATMLRSRFIHNPKVDEATRWEQALSTFSKLDVTEPGLSYWIQQTLEHKPEAQKQLGKKLGIPVALMIRGGGLSKQAAFESIKKAMAMAGAHLEQVPLEKAAFVLKLGADEARDQEGAVAVRVTLDVERTEHGKPIWQNSTYRSTLAKNADLAILGSVEWLARIGGRDLLFRWLSESALPNAIAHLPGVSDPTRQPKPGPAPVRAPPPGGSEKVTIPPHP